MVNPEIKVVWGGDWKSTSRKIARPVVRDIVEISSTAVEGLNIAYEQPKSLTVLRASNSHKLMGSAEGAQDYEIYFKIRDLKHRKLAGLWLEFMLSGFHELLHNIRAENYDPKNSLVELVATEALSHTGEDILVKMLDKAGEVELLSDYIDVAEVEARNRGKAQLLKSDEDYTGVGTDQDYAILDDWLPYGEIPVLTRGVMFGVTEVQAHLDSGVPFGDLVHWPASKVLNLGEIAA